MLDYPTPHIQASPSDFAPVVLMPGDPLRSQYIAKEFLENARLVNNVRGVQGYTGIYEGVPVSVMASGMGMPSMAIYSYELYHAFGVETIIRIGSCGGLQDQVKVRDLVLAQAASTDSAYADRYDLKGSFAPVADFGLLQKAAALAQLNQMPYHVGGIVTSDRFYEEQEHLPPTERNAVLWKRMGVLAVEMETAALYINAARSGKRALSVCTVSDHLFTGESLSAHERQTSFNEMIELTLQVAKTI